MKGANGRDGVLPSFCAMKYHAFFPFFSRAFS
jgi:hypothetical protein